jgi:RHS repeat-associated protein
MGYFLTTEPENAVPENSFASPKTHTPLSRLEERGRRFYSPEVGRWVNRDPIEESDQACLYCFLSNTPIYGIDRLGLFTLIIDPSGVNKGKWSWEPDC